jgi:FMN phosphatase YigB (HAD superfamily)
MVIDRNIQTIIFDLDGTLYYKRGLARRMLLRLWWCLPLLISERIARKKIVTCAYDSPERFYEAFFQTMARGHWWNAQIARKWYHTIYMPTMVRIIAKHQQPNASVINTLIHAKQKGLVTILFSDYGCAKEKLQAIGLAPALFSFIIDAPTLGGLKPNKTVIYRLLERTGTDPKKTLFIGDRIDKDGGSAQAVGATFWNVSI